MLERVIFAGFGGQGVLTIGKMVAELGMDAFPQVTYFPSYGTEVRGGTANCQVILSGEEIASPIVETADSLILMNQPSLEKFFHLLKRGGRAFVNNSLAQPVEDKRVVALPATELANRLQDVRAANIIILGAYLAGQKWASKKAFEKLLSRKLKTKGEKTVRLNLKALEIGWSYGKSAT